MEKGHIPIQTSFARIAAVIAGLICVVTAGVAVTWSFAGAIATQTDLVEGAEFAVGLSPNDPQTHFALAVLADQSFDPTDAGRSVDHFQRAAALSPYNYLIWIELGRAFERAGDAPRAEAALRRTLALAPNYSIVQWTLGNFLIRQGRLDEGFAELRKAAAGDTKYAGPAVDLASQLFGGDLAQIRSALGDSPEVNATLAVTLAKQGKFEDAMSVWRSMKIDGPNETLTVAGRQLIDLMAAAKRFRYTAEIIVAVRPEGMIVPAIGSVINGGFEDEIALTEAGQFGWRLGTGTSPLIGQTPSQVRSGQYSLLLAYRGASGSGVTRTLQQSIPVEPGSKYSLSLAYRTELKTSAQLVWTVTSASDNSPIAATPGLLERSDWTTVSVEFTVPTTDDGIIISLGQTECKGGNCAINGEVWFDDVVLTAR